MDSISDNINIITIDVVSNIQKELDLCDVCSLVFLLYDVPYIALERLTLLQGIPRKKIDLLGDWAKQAQSRTTWRFEFLEALTICQLYRIIRNLGFDVKTVKLHFLPNNIYLSHYINPMKRILYKLCENLNSNNLIKLKAAINNVIDLKEYEVCELILLKLICTKYIILESNQCDVNKLAEVVDTLPGLDSIASELRQMENQINQVKSNDKYVKCNKSNDSNSKCDNEESTYKFIKKTISKCLDSAYKIIDKNRLGICYIINQERFYQSPESKKMQCEDLEFREGSYQDKIDLQKTMEALNFKVLIDDNLSYDNVFDNLNRIVHNEVIENDSMFLLCILSHGIKGCVYSSDSLPIEVNKLKVILEGENAHKLIGKPKVLIIQACQAIQDTPPTLATDGPNHSRDIGKSDFLILWATVPEYMAYRCPKKGSFFIQILCLKIKQLAPEEHLEDIFKTVNNDVVQLCIKNNCKQVAMSESTLRKKIYLQLQGI